MNETPTKPIKNHYDWLDVHLWDFLKQCEVNPDWHAGIISAHGDKAYSYQTPWEKAGVPFYHGVAIFLLSYCAPYADEVRETKDKGWVDVCQWVIDNYARFKDKLGPIPVKPTEGWMYLHNSPKWHYFRDKKSLCKRWMCFGQDFADGNDNSPDNCKACMKARAKEQAK